VERFEGVWGSKGLEQNFGILMMLSFGRLVMRRIFVFGRIIGQNVVF